MKSTLGRRGLALLGVAAASLAVAGGIAYATIPDSGNTDHACMLNNVGTIRIIDSALPSNSLLQHCTKIESEITFDQQGPRGLQGAKGVPGPQGPVGPAGPSDVYVGDSGQGGLFGDGTTAYRTIATMTLPAGSYLFQASALVENYSDVGQPLVVRCQIVAPGVTGPVVPQLLAGRTKTDPVFTDRMPMITAGTTTGGTASVQCAIPEDRTGYVYSFFYATKVSTIH
ncbi:MAG TPA: hypothetical protein VH538_00810 [Gaiellaceae bacterium]